MISITPEKNYKGREFIPFKGPVSQYRILDIGKASRFNGRLCVAVFASDAGIKGITKKRL